MIRKINLFHKLFKQIIIKSTMFKKKCSNCKKKIEKNYDFCPYCGKNLIKKEDYGLLGKNDFDENNMNLFGGSLIEKLFNSAINIFEKQIKQISKQPNFQNPNLINNPNFRLVINGKEIKINQNKNSPTRNQNNLPSQNIELKKEISTEKANQFAKLPKEEPTSKIKRIEGRLIYEISIPGVENIEDILINKLENSIEIKALSKDKVYSKNLNINLPIKGYRLYKGNLILELESK